MINSETVKKKAMQFGADICGIASISRFVDAPNGFHPCDIYPDCKSAIVYASHFPLGTLKSKTNTPYTLVRNTLVQKLDLLSFNLSDELERDGITSVPVPSADPYDYWDAKMNHGRGILSLKHAGVLAGLGKMGKNTLLINDRYGNMIWLGAVLVEADLEPDPMASYDGCPEKCRICIDLCPQDALDGKTINQKLCRENSTSCTDGGGWILSCNICRKSCPNHGRLKIEG